MGQADGQLTVGERAGAQVVKSVQVRQVKLTGVIQMDFAWSLHLPWYGVAENVQGKSIY